jgi:hypothetical protein
VKKRREVSFLVRGMEGKDCSLGGKILPTSENEGGECCFTFYGIWNLCVEVFFNCLHRASVVEKREI